MQTQPASLKALTSSRSPRVPLALVFMVFLCIMGFIILLYSLKYLL